MIVRASAIARFFDLENQRLVARSRVDRAKNSLFVPDRLFADPNDDISPFNPGAARWSTGVDLFEFQAQRAIETGGLPLSEREKSRRSSSSGSSEGSLDSRSPTAHCPGRRHSVSVVVSYPSKRLGDSQSIVVLVFQCRIKLVPIDEPILVVVEKVHRITIEQPGERIRENASDAGTVRPGGLPRTGSRDVHDAAVLQEQASRDRPPWRGSLKPGRCAAGDRGRSSDRVQQSVTTTTRAVRPSSTREGRIEREPSCRFLSGLVKFKTWPSSGRTSP